MDFQEDITINGDKIAEIARKQIDTCVKFKQPRLAEIKESFDIYANFTTETLTSRFNMPLPIMGGFIDTLKSKIDDAPAIKYSEDDEADYHKVRKANAMWKKDSSDAIGQWAQKDRAVKTSALFSGRGICQIFAESDPEYASIFEPIDIFDFIFEPQGGGILENHLFTGQLNLFRSKSAIEAGAKSGYYDPAQVSKLFNSVGYNALKENNDYYKNKQSRFTVYGLDPESNNYVGEKLYNLAQMYVTFMGKRYQLVFDAKTGIWIRLKEIKEVFKGGRYPYCSFATHEDYWNFMSKAPADDIRIVAEVMKVIINQVLENNQKKNWGMKLVDMSKIKHPHQLNWRPDGVIEVKDTLGTSLQNIVMPIQNPDNIQLSLELINFFDTFTGKQTGITAEAKGVSDKDAKVGIYYGNLQQVADRLGLLNKSYTEMYAQVGVRYLEGLEEHLTNKVAVKYIGVKGAEWLECQKADFKFKNQPSVVVESSSAEAELDETKNKRRGEVMIGIASNPELMKQVNPKWLVEGMLKQAEFSDEEVQIALDTKNEGSQALLAEAAESIKLIVMGKKPKLNRAATTSFVQKILDKSLDIQEEKPEIGDALRKYAQDHIPIAVENMMRKAQGFMPPPAPEMPAPGSPAPASPPAMGTPAGTASMGQELSNQANPMI